MDDQWITCPNMYGRAEGAHLVRAAAVVDGVGVDAAPGALLLRDGQVVAAGSVAAIGVVEDARVVDRPEAVVMPAHVNTHAHLDLSHLGPREYGGDFCGWIDSIRSGRAIDDAGIAASVRRGIELSIAGGVGIVGDVAGAGSVVPIRTLRESQLGGVAFLEVFGIGRGQVGAVETLERAAREIPRDAGEVRLGLQPHAPYSCGPLVYQAAARLGHPLATHLAETLDEVRFLRGADGPLAEMLRRFGVPRNDLVAWGTHPVEWLISLLRGEPCLAAHLNYVDEQHLERLQGSGIRVAYCPRASGYFGHPAPGHPSHRYLQMIESGIEVSLGTDSLVCLDTADRIGVLDEMRLLYRRDSVAPRRLLRMGTVDGANALGVDPTLATLAPGRIAGVIAVPTPDQNDPLRGVLRSDGAPEWIVGPG